MKKIWIIIGILVVIVAAAAYLNRDNITANKKSQDNATFSIKSGGQQVCTLDMNSIKGMKKQTFDAEIKADGKVPAKHIFTGVPMKEIFENKKINTDGKTKVIVKAADGYTSAITINEAMQDDNVYIVYEIDGKPLGKKEDGGAGPFEMVITKDPYSQRWCKFVMEVDLE